MFLLASNSTSSILVRINLTAVDCGLLRCRCEGRWNHLVITTADDRGGLLWGHSSFALLILGNELLEELTVLEFGDACDLTRS
mgnify:CR=1 FL=1